MWMCSLKSILSRISASSAGFGARDAVASAGSSVSIMPMGMMASTGSAVLTIDALTMHMGMVASVGSAMSPTATLIIGMVMSVRHSFFGDVVRALPSMPTVLVNCGISAV